MELLTSLLHISPLASFIFTTTYHSFVLLMAHELFIITIKTSPWSSIARKIYEFSFHSCDDGIHVFYSIINWALVNAIDLPNNNLQTSMGMNYKIFHLCIHLFHLCIHLCIQTILMYYRHFILFFESKQHIWLAGSYHTNPDFFTIFFSIFS